MSLARRFVTPYDLYLLCVIALVKAVHRSHSLRLARYLSRFAGQAAWRLSRRRRQSREQILAQTLDISAAETQRVVKRCFYEFWNSVFSLPHYGIQRSDSQTAELRGLDHLKNALAKGRGVILWESNSFGKRVLAKRVLHQNGFSVCQIHAQNHLEGFRNSESWIAKNVIQPFFEDREKPFVKEILYLTSGDISFNRALFERLQRNAILCIAADGRQGHKFVPVQFLGQSALFSTGMISLAKLSVATILPLFCIQRGTEKAAVIIEAPIQIEASGDRERGLERSVKQYAGVLESYIRTYPEQYLSWYPLPLHDPNENNQTRIHRNN